MVEVVEGGGVFLLFILADKSNSKAGPGMAKPHTVTLRVAVERGT